jgi:hypothetical protein
MTATAVRHHRRPDRARRRMAARCQPLGDRRLRLACCSSAYSLSWIAACVGLNSKSPESAASFGFIVLFPLAFVSNAMVPTQHMPGWLQAIANWNPVSAVTAGARHLWGNPNPSAPIQRVAHAASGGGRPDLVGGHPGHRRTRWRRTSSRSATTE